MIGVETIVGADAWREAIPEPEEFAARIFSAACAAEPRLRGELALLLTNDKAVRSLNRRFRDKDMPTNVLSFPSGEAAPSFLGDVALALETCLREAAEKKFSAEAHTAHLIVHGFLHLVGYDHQIERDAERMEGREAEVLDALGFSNPYEEQEI